MAEHEAATRMADLCTSLSDINSSFPAFATLKGAVSLYFLRWFLEVTGCVAVVTLRKKMLDESG